MDSCCAVHPIHTRQRRTILIVLWLNAVMFGIELVAGLVAHSTALLADSVDMLGDAIVYGFSLYAIGRASIWQRRAALLKGLIMSGFAVVVLGEVATKVLWGATPDAATMWRIAVLALAVNAIALWLLWRIERTTSIWARHGSARGMTWPRTRAWSSGPSASASGSAWPDILVGLAIATLFGLSAASVIREAIAGASRPASSLQRPFEWAHLAWRPVLRWPLPSIGPCG